MADNIKRLELFVLYAAQRTRGCQSRSLATLVRADHSALPTFSAGHVSGM